jgi:probable HAF family extracellular repeat protein
VTALSALASPLTGVAQERQADRPKHHHYKVIDIGTFGGPQSYFDDLNLTDAFGFNTVFYNFSLIRNSKGVLVGFADTPTPDPNSANPPLCYVPDCFVTHAYAWQNGVKADLGVLPGGASSAAFWINSNGLIAGNSQNGETDPVIPGLPEIRAVIWKNGQIRDLGTLGGSASFSQAVNNRGQVTGLALNGIADPFSFYYEFLYCVPPPSPFNICPANPTQTRGFVWDEEDGMQDIGTLGGPDAFPSLINNHGQIAGFSYTDYTPNPATGMPTLHPFLWEKEKGMQDLGSLGGTITASVNGLNERGEVVGGALLAGDVINHPFLWDGEKLIDLVAPPFGGSAPGEAAWINEAGEVVGSAGIPAPCPGSSPPREAAHAFLWRKGVMTDLGTLGGSPLSGSTFINSKSQIVGLAFPCDFSAVTAFLWEDGSMADLNTLVPSDNPFYLFSASFIDDRGQIAAFGSLANGDMHALLLIPCDEGHPNVEGCDYRSVDPAQTAERPLDANRAHQVPEIFRQRLGTRLFPLGPVSGMLSISDDAAGSPQKASPSGTGSTTTPYLNGRCYSKCKPPVQVSQCRAGQPAKTPGFDGCPGGLALIPVDLGTPCSVPPGGFHDRGHCETE